MRCIEIASICLFATCVSWDDHPDADRIDLESFREAFSGACDGSEYDCHVAEKDCPHDTSESIQRQEGTILSFPDRD